MARFQQINLETRNMNEKISRKLSMYSDGLRQRLGVIRDFQGDFDDAFRGFIENKLPKDDLYREIEAAHEEKRRKKEMATQGIMAQPVLPKVKVSDQTKQRDKDVIEHRKQLATEAIIAKKAPASQAGVREQEEEAPHGKKLSEVQSMIKIQEARQELAEYDFELINKQVQSNLKAVMTGDQKEYEKIQRIQGDKKALANYLGENADKKKNEEQQDAMSEEEYAKDLDKSAYQDFWEDLSQQKAQKRRGSQSFNSRGNMTSRGSQRRGSLLPDINKKLEESTLYEASIFGGKTKKPKKAAMVEEDDSASEAGPKKQAKAKPAGIDKRVLDKLKREKDALEKRLNVMLSTHKIEQEQAKIHAKQMGEKMIEQRLNACTEVYEQEFEVLVSTFEELKTEVDAQRLRENELREKLGQQDQVILQLNQFVENTGYDLRQGDTERSLSKIYGGNSAEEILETTIQIQDEPDLVPNDVKEAIAAGDRLLDAQFNFYGFQMKITKNHQIDIVNRQLLRFYKKRIYDLAQEKEQLIVEMDSMRSMMNTFKQESLRSERKIKELEIKEQLVTEERRVMKQQLERRIKMLAKEFEVFYLKLGDQFDSFRSYVICEADNYETIQSMLNKMIKARDNKILDLEEALSVPRKHYHHIDTIQSEEIIVQKEEIVANMSAQTGIPKEKLLDALHKNEARKQAEREMEEAMKYLKKDEEGEEDDEAQEVGKPAAAPKAAQPESKAGKEGFGADKQAASEKQLDLGSLGASSPRLQRNMSTKTIFSKATADTLAGSVVAPPFKFGVQKQYKNLGDFQVSSKLLLTRKQSGDIEMTVNTTKKDKEGLLDKAEESSLKQKRHTVAM